MFMYDIEDRFCNIPKAFQRTISKSIKGKSMKEWKKETKTYDIHIGFVVILKLFILWSKDLMLHLLGLL